MGNFAKQAFSSDQSRSKRTRIFPVFAKSEKKIKSVFIPVECVSCAVSRIYFILFILFYFMSIPAKANRTNQRSNERCAEGRVCIAHTLCIYMIYMFAVSLANSRFYDYPSLCCSRSLR